MNLSVSKLQTLVILTFIAINFSQVAKAEDKYLDDPPQEKTWTIMNQCKSKLVSRAGGKIKVKHTLADWPKFNISDIPSDRAKRGGFYQNLIDQAFEKYSDQSSFVRCYNNAFNSALGKADNNDKEEASCKENIKEMDKDISEMIKLCGEANMGSSTAKCLDQARQCQSCDPNDPDDDDCDEDDVGTVEAYAGGIQQILNGGRTRQVTPNMATSMKKFSSCPALAGEDLDELQKEAEEMEKDRDDLTKQLHEMQEKANNLVDEQQDAETAVQAEIDQLDKDIKDEMQKIADDERSIDQGTKELFFEIENGIANAEREIRGLEIAKHDANIAFDEKMAEASARCHEAALEKLKRLNTEKQQLIQASLYSAGGFNDLMKSAGLSNKERMKKKVDDYYRECKLDRSFKDNQILLQKKLNSEKEKLMSKSAPKKKLLPV